MEPTNHRPRQIGALPLILSPYGRPDLCLVTTRGGGRWIIPKGNPIAGLAPHEVAEREAFEEAGLVGAAGRSCIGSFEFQRTRAGCAETCVVDVYPLYVDRRLSFWTEARERSVVRCRPDAAKALVQLPGLAALIEQFTAVCACREAARA